MFNSFDRVWIENLHGNRKISEYAPDGRTSETVFAVAGFSPGIQQGVATTLWVRNSDTPNASVLFRDDLNAAKAEDRRGMLLDSLNEHVFDAKYQAAFPTKENRFSFWPQALNTIYNRWPKVTDLCVEAPSNGLMEKRGGALIDIDRALLEERMRLYHDKNLDWDAYRLASSTLTGEWAGFDAKKVRARALDYGFRSEQVVRYAARPFDTRWCYYSAMSPLWNRSRPPLWSQRFEGNVFLIARMRSTASPEGFPMSFTTCLSDDHYVTPDAVAVPFLLRKAAPKANKNDAFAPGIHGQLFGNEAAEGPAIAGNLSALATSFLQSLGMETSPENATVLWLHTLAIGYSPAYLNENADGIRQDWPRIPLPSSPGQFSASTALGHRVAGLLDTEHPAHGVTAGALRPELRGVAALTRIDGKPLDAGEDFKLTAGWGHAGKDGVTMPGRGKLFRRERTAKESADLEKGIAALGIPKNAALTSLGSGVVDVYLNDRCAWTNIPESVWELYIGGYQVMKKWLSYREFSFLKRSLTLGEVEEVQAMARRLAALCLLQPELDANYLSVKSATWQSETTIAE